MKVPITPRNAKDVISQVVHLAAQNASLKQWIREEGIRTDTCTYDILKEICEGCRCKRHPAIHTSDPSPMNDNPNKTPENGNSGPMSAIPAIPAKHWMEIISVFLNRFGTQTFTMEEFHAILPTDGIQILRLPDGTVEIHKFTSSKLDSAQ
jgi:hypothetical protein